MNHLHKRTIVVHEGIDLVANLTQLSSLEHGTQRGPRKRQTHSGHLQLKDDHVHLVTYLTQRPDENACGDDYAFRP